VVAAALVVGAAAGRIVVACSAEDSLSSSSSSSSTNGSGGNGGGPGCFAGGGCIDFDEGRGCEADPKDCALRRVGNTGALMYCGATDEHTEAWTIAASTCTGIADGYYLALVRGARDESVCDPSACTCPGWADCIIGAYSSATDPDPAGSAWDWKVGGPEGECQDFPPSCGGLPFHVEDAEHATVDLSCDYQCTGTPMSGRAAASCTGPNAEMCTFTYTWAADVLAESVGQ
jgi:hypothetical protein